MYLASVLALISFQCHGEKATSTKGWVIITNYE